MRFTPRPGGAPRSGRGCLRCELPVRHADGAPAPAHGVTGPWRAPRGLRKWLLVRQRSPRGGGRGRGSDRSSNRSAEPHLLLQAALQRTRTETLQPRNVRKGGSMGAKGRLTVTDSGGIPGTLRAEQKMARDAETGRLGGERLGIAERRLRTADQQHRESKDQRRMHFAHGAVSFHYVRAESRLLSYPSSHGS